YQFAELSSKFEEFLKTWLPASWVDSLNSGLETKIRCIDWENGTIRSDGSWGRLPHSHQFPVLADDGRTFFSIVNEDPTGPASIYCWDVPAQRRWEWIIGVPAALTLPVLAWRSWRGWRRRRRDVGAARVAS